MRHRRRHCSTRKEVNLLSASIKKEKKESAEIEKHHAVFSSVLRKPSEHYILNRQAESGRLAGVSSRRCTLHRWRWKKEDKDIEEFRVLVRTFAGTDHLA